MDEERILGMLDRLLHEIQELKPLSYTLEQRIEKLEERVNVLEIRGSRVG